jgi:hypothetical protein
VEDVAVRWCDVDVTGDDEVGVVDEPAAHLLRECVDECELVLVVPVIHRPPVRYVGGDNPQRLGDADDAAQDARLPVEVLVAEVTRGDD